MPCCRIPAPRIKKGFEMRAAEMRLSHSLFLVMMEGLTAFVLPSKPGNRGCVSSSFSRLSNNVPITLQRNADPKLNVRSSLRMQQQDCASAVQRIKTWADAPSFLKECKIVCCPARSEAAGNQITFVPIAYSKNCEILSLFSFAVISTFFSEIFSPVKSKTVLTSSTLDSMTRVCSYVNSIVPTANAAVVKGAPLPCMVFESKFLQQPGSTKEKLSDQEVPITLASCSCTPILLIYRFLLQVMGKILDWFTQLLIGMDDEEEYVNVGRRLLSVNKYAVSTAATSEAVHEVDSTRTKPP
jgi:hypothetical protein